MKIISNAAKAEATEYAVIFNKELQRAVDVSKTSLDLAAEQNIEVLAACKHALKESYRPGLFLLDFAAQAFESYVTIHKHLLDYAVEQSAAVIELAQKYSYDLDEAEVFTESLVRQTAGRTIAAEKSVLKTATRNRPSQ